VLELSSLNPNAYDSYRNILRVLAHAKKPMTWNEVWRKTKLSKGCFSQRFRELIKSGHIKGEIIVDEKNRLIPVYKHTGKQLVFCFGETKDVLRVYFPKQDKGIIYAEERRKIRKPKARLEDRFEKNPKRYYTRRVKRDV